MTSSHLDGAPHTKRCCRKAYGRLAGWQSDKAWRGEANYEGMVEVSRALMKATLMSPLSAKRR